MRPATRAALLGTLLALVYVALSLRALPAYGIAWDEGLGDLFFGHRNLAYLTTGDARFLDFDTRLPVDGDGLTHPDLFLSPLRFRPWEHWPVVGTLSALLCQGLARGAHPLLDPVDAHHLAPVLVTALLLPLIAAMAARAWGTTAGMVAAATLVLHPRYLAASWFDLKDAGSAAFVTAGLLLAWHGLAHGRTWALPAAGVVLGLALGTKLNVLFAPLPLGVFLILAWPALRPPPRTALVLATALGVVLVGVVLVASWGWLRQDPVARMLLNLQYIGGRATSGSLWPHPLPVLTALATWPAGTLGLVLVGCAEGARALRRRSADLAGLALLATLFPLARLASPGVLSFDGIRHALEFVPAAALLAGAGAAAIGNRLAPRPRLAALALGLALLEPAVETVFVHPHEVAHASFLVGGPWGAKRLGLPVEDYWATGYRRAYAWLNAHAEPGAVVGAGIAPHVLDLEGPLRLRSDLRILPAGSPFTAEPDPRTLAAFAAAAARGPTSAYLLFVTREEWYSSLVRDAARVEPVYTDGPPGVTLVEIVRMPRAPAIGVPGRPDHGDR